jgi:hypothetical protein
MSLALRETKAMVQIESTMTVDRDRVFLLGPCQDLEDPARTLDLARSWQRDDIDVLVLEAFLE